MFAFLKLIFGVGGGGGVHSRGVAFCSPLSLMHMIIFLMMAWWQLVGKGGGGGGGGVCNNGP